MLTGHANLDVAVEGMDLGAFDYLMKPTDVDELLYKLEDAFKRKIIKEQQTESL
jgi:DNA-binding NtrC family response regulator